ncbi:hypothetical protein A7U60_g7652 [Sanghuangporus baumii]|uniref:Uncharacterized protein n=1 Tax=Sanghuangporus baumii TaxID=108892 RepID=A0A9Q5HST8_SANBA|nr:hypothetical protein A7U60_g7652 [Sanghuangporus baumii]
MDDFAVDTFGNNISESAKRAFMERADEYSETEIISATTSLTGRIKQLSGHLIREKNRMRECLEMCKPNWKEDTIAQCVHNAIGDRCQQLAHIKINGGAPTAVNRTIRESLNAWSIYCMYRAIKPMLFGWSLRIGAEIEGICTHMAQHEESDLQTCWTLLRECYPPREIETIDQDLVEALEELNQTQEKDMMTFDNVFLEDTYCRGIARDYVSPVPLHWRALVHKHELELHSYREAISRTEQVLQQGLDRVFCVAGIDASASWDKPSTKRMISNVVHDAATLAKYMRTGVFSENIEVVLVEPESKYEKELMRSADELDKGKVKYTVTLGLRVEGEKELLLKPEVLLT